MRNRTGQNQTLWAIALTIAFTYGIAAMTAAADLTTAAFPRPQTNSGQTQPVAEAPREPQPSQPRREEKAAAEPESGFLPFLVLMALGIGLGLAMLYWASKIGNDGYHLSQTGYPAPDDGVERLNDSKTTTPIP